MITVMRIAFRGSNKQVHMILLTIHCVLLDKLDVDSSFVKIDRLVVELRRDLSPWSKHFALKKVKQK